MSRPRRGGRGGGVHREQREQRIVRNRFSALPIGAPPPPRASLTSSSVEAQKDTVMELVTMAQKSEEITAFIDSELLRRLLPQVLMQGLPLQHVQDQQQQQQKQQPTPAIPQPKLAVDQQRLSTTPTRQRHRKLQNMALGRSPPQRLCLEEALQFQGGDEAQKALHFSGCQHHEVDTVDGTPILVIKDMPVSWTTKSISELVQSVCGICPHCDISEVRREGPDVLVAMCNWALARKCLNSLNGHVVCHTLGRWPLRVTLVAEESWNANREDDYMEEAPQATTGKTEARLYDGMSSLLATMMKEQIPHASTSLEGEGHLDENALLNKLLQ